MIDFVGVVLQSTAGVVDVLRGSDLDAPVPTCPGWSVADLGYHLYDVQTHFATIVEEERTERGDLADAPRPPDRSLADALHAASERLGAAIRHADPSQRFHTWAGLQPVSWIARRQAHEALIHGADAAAAVGAPVDIETSVARDGIEEVMEWFHGAPPQWAEWMPSDAIGLVEAGGEGRWRLEWGRLRGTSPTTGTDYDVEMAVAAEDGPVSAVVTSGAGALDLWLWRRLPVGAVDRIEGDRELVERIYEALVID